MFKIKYYLGKSKINGIGIFSGENIAKGKTIYLHNKKLRCEVSRDEFEKLEEEDKRIFKHYGYFDEKLNLWILDYDDIRFCNHSEKGNITFDGEKIISKRDIQEGEELLQDYKEFGGKFY